MPPIPPPGRPSVLDTLRWWLACQIARPLIRREVRQSFEDGYAMGVRHGIQIEAEDPGTCKRLRIQDAETTPEPHDACTTSDPEALTAANPHTFDARPFRANPVRDILR